MALAKTYIYKFSPSDSQDLAIVLDVSEEIHVDKDTWFTYQKIDGMIYPYRSSSGEESPQTPLEFFKRYPNVSIVTKSLLTNIRGLELSKIEGYFDYTKMINDLEMLGKVKTAPSNNWLATDPREFWFVDDSDLYSVDCLGTNLCQHISEKVRKEWLSIMV